MVCSSQCTRPADFGGHDSVCMAVFWQGGGIRSGGFQHVDWPARDLVVCSGSFPGNIEERLRHVGSEQSSKHQSGAHATWL